MRVLYFAWLRERIGTNAEEFDLPPEVTTAQMLVDWLRARGPRYEAAFANLTGIRVAVDQRHASLSAPLAGVREVAFFPPVTGG